MKKLFILSSIIAFLLSGCIVIEDEPMVTVNPTIFFQGYVSNDSVYVTATIWANPAYLNIGNIQTVFVYKGQLQLIHEDTGEILARSELTEGGLTSIVEVSTATLDFEKIIIIASGSVSAYADKESDGDSSNDLFIHSYDFYEVTQMSEVINIEDYPVVVLSPVIDFQTYISNKQLVVSTTISARPTYIVTGSVPIIFDYSGLIQISSEYELLDQKAIFGQGLAVNVAFPQDTGSFNRFLVEATGTITASADIGNDGNPDNDLFISSIDFNEVLEIDLD